MFDVFSSIRHAQISPRKEHGRYCAYDILEKDQACPQGAKLRGSTNVSCFDPRTNTTKEDNRGVYTVGVGDITERR